MMPEALAVEARLAHLLMLVRYARDYPQSPCVRAEALREAIGETVMALQAWNVALGANGQTVRPDAR